MTGQLMIKVSVEVRNGTARFRVSVQAENVRRALGVVGDRYPHGETRLVFPGEPEGFFFGEPSVPTMAAGYEHTHEMAA